MASDKTNNSRTGDITAAALPDGASESLQKPRPLHGRTSGPTRRSTKGQWTAEEDALLCGAVERFKGRNWKKIAECFTDRTDVQCLHRWQKVLNPELVKGPWSKEEDDIIIALVGNYGAKKWSTIAQSLPGRIGKQCRERWHNHLNPGINKEAWTQEEELALIRAHQIYGNKWAELTKFLTGRTDNAIKNHWNSSVKKKLDSYLASGLLAQFQGPAPVENPNLFISSSFARKQQNGGDVASINGAEIEEISESSQGSGPVGCSQSDCDVANAILEHVREEFNQREEAVERKVQNSHILGCKQQYATTNEASCAVVDMPCGAVNASDQTMFNEVGLSENNICQLNSYELHNTTASLDAVLESTALLETLTHTSGVGKNPDTESVLVHASVESHAPPVILVVPDNPVDGELAFGDDGNEIKLLEPRICEGFCLGNNVEGSNIIDLDGCAGSLIHHSDIEGSDWAISSASSSHPYYLPRSSDMLGTSCFQSLFSVVSPSLPYPGDGKLVFINDSKEVGDISNGIQDLDLFTCSSNGLIYLNDPISSPCGNHSAKGCMPVELDQKNDSGKSIPVEMFGSVSSDAVGNLACMDGSAAVPAEPSDSGALFYEPPRFPSLEFPFFSCDLVPSGGEAYSPLGIRQLMMSSMNCSTPCNLWDSPSHDNSPDAVLKSAARSFMCTPSILKKRQRDLLSPLLEKKSGKKPGKEMDHGVFSTSSSLNRSVFPCPDTILDKRGACKASTPTIEGILSPTYMKNKAVASPKGKENPNHACSDRKDGTFLDGRCSGKYDKSHRQDDIKYGTTDSDLTTKTDLDNSLQTQPSAVLVEHNMNEMLFFSPPQDGCPLNKSLNSHSESCTGEQCFSGFLSSSAGKKKHERRFISHPLQVTCEKVGSSNNADIENVNIIADIPGIERGIESPSAWKSPGFMNSLLPGHRFDSDVIFEDVGYFLSPGDRTYDAIGLMRQLNEHTAAAMAEAQEVLASGNLEWDAPQNSFDNSQFPDNELENCIHLPSGALPFQTECRVLDFSDCGTPGTENRKTPGVGTTVGFSSPSSLLKGFR